MDYHYKPVGTCSSEILVDVDAEGIVRHVRFVGGCPGNLAAISAIVEGYPYQKLIELWRGNKCGYRDTSCVDQLTYALEAAVAAQKQRA